MFLVITKKQIKRISMLTILTIIFTSLALYLYFIVQHKGLVHTISKIEHKYVILIHIDESKLFLLDNNDLLKKYPIASGTPEWPSPIGDWKIISKGDWGEGFGGRWMGLNVRWGNYGIHGTTEEYSIGSASSHGCIRMYNKDIKELYNIIPIGTPVIIKNGSFGAFGTGFRNLIPGDRGADVLAVQERLKALGYFKGYASGIYEDDLKIALHKFQKDKQIEIKNTITVKDYNCMDFREFE